MLPEEIVNILSKYQDKVAEEISNINLAIDKIKYDLKTISSVLVDDLISYAKNTGISNKDKEIELLKDSQVLREYYLSLDKLIFNKSEIESGDKNEERLYINDVIVLSNTLKCSTDTHKTKDINAKIPVLYDTGDVVLISVMASYCADCQRYTILKDDFRRISGVIMCKVVDETAISSNQYEDELDIKQKESILYMYGYNVKSKNNLSSKQRHIILSSIVESGIMNRRQIADHLSTLIIRGDKIPAWKEATTKWKQDKYYIQSYKKENLPNVIFNKVILKYKTSSQDDVS